ncbi:hypothetical protein S83_052185, partial [Arachis hypogaea]
RESKPQSRVLTLTPARIVSPLVHPLASLSSCLHHRLLAGSIVCSSHGLRQNLGGSGGAPQYIQSNVNANNQNCGWSRGTAEEEEAVWEFMVKEISKTQETNSSRSTMELGTSSNQNVPRDVAQPIIGHPSNHCSAAQHKGTEDVFISDKFKPKEITAIMNDFAEPGSLAFTALYLGGTKYMVIQSEPGAVIREKK